LSAVGAGNLLGLIAVAPLDRLDQTPVLVERDGGRAPRLR
jgi:hypothetical protein